MAAEACGHGNSLFVCNALYGRRFLLKGIVAEAQLLRRVIGTFGPFQKLP